MLINSLCFERWTLKNGYPNARSHSEYPDIIKITRHWLFCPPITYIYSSYIALSISFQSHRDTYRQKSQSSGSRTYLFADVLNWTPNASVMWKSDITICRCIELDGDESMDFELNECVFNHLMNDVLL